MPKQKNTANTGKYLIKNPISLKFIIILDYFINLFFKKHNRNLKINKIEKILISNGAHLGDVLITSYVINIIKNKYPNAMIGFCVGSWSKKILEINSIDFIHIIDHFKLNRGNISFFRKLLIYIKTSIISIIDIRDINYDVVIDFYSYFPNNIPIFFLCNIPQRIGYTSGGFGGLLTHEIAWLPEDKQIFLYHLDLLKCIGISIDNIEASNFATINRSKNILQNRYVVIHVGTGSQNREWKVEYWRELVKYLLSEGKNVYLTGSGNREAEIVDSVLKNISGCKNLVNKLSFNEFIDVIKNAEVHIGVESFSGHVAAGVDIYSIIIKSGITSDAQWGPLSKKTYIARANVECAPCHKKSGCKGMNCINDVRPSDIIEIYKNIWN